MQANKPKRKRQKHCLSCHELFLPDPRTKDKQRYCSQPQCQKVRQRKNEAAWRLRNPECVELQREQTRQWHKGRPDYSRERRNQNPQLLVRNREQTRLRLRKFRQKEMFDKSKSILAQLTANKADRYYLSKGKSWLHIRLTKASLLSRIASISNNKRIQSKIITNCLPRGKLFMIYPGKDGG